MNIAKENECKYYPCNNCKVNSKDDWGEWCSLRARQIKVGRIVFCFLKEAFGKKFAPELRDKFISEAKKTITQAEIRKVGSFCAEVIPQTFIYLWMEPIPLGIPGGHLRAPCISSKKKKGKGRLRLGGFHPSCGMYAADIVEKEVIT